MIKQVGFFLSYISQPVMGRYDTTTSKSFIFCLCPIGNRAIQVTHNFPKFCFTKFPIIAYPSSYDIIDICRYES